MAIGVDTSKWKPRKITGTPANKFSYVLGLGILTVGTLCGIGFHFSKFTVGIRKASEAFYEEDIAEVERGMLIASGLNRNAAMIRKMMEEEEQNKTNENTRVLSKYFVDKPVMDNSLSDFEEKKPFAVPKKPEKSSTSKPKPKKILKRIRGQKDIRTALKTKNELISYSNEFDKVCKLTGIDVDTEQLQLAIALSKSLQEKDNIEALNSDTIKYNSETNSSSQERIGKIRSTLLEYGFIVPEIKIETKKRGKKVRKDYKLLLTSDAEKQQIIADKYSEVLLRHINKCQSPESKNCSDNIKDKHNKLYKFATNTSYKCIKSDTTFYIDSLLEPNKNTTGSLLRDWSEIPGRPCSPEIEKVNFQFTESDITEVELDIVLSGTLKSVQDIIRDKIFTDVFIRVKNNQNDIIKEAVNVEDGGEIISVDDYHRVNQVNNETVDLESPNKLTMSHTLRSYSPDIFDDEVSSVMEQSSTHNIEIISQEIPFRNETNINNDVMDLTECVKTSNAKCSQVLLSQGTNVTKRKSDDFMEITDCVIVSSQPIKDNIDLTYSPDKENDTYSNNINKSRETKTIDLTQSGEDKGIDELNTSNNNAKNMDTTQSDSNDSLPFVLISGTDKSLDDTVILNKEDLQSLKLTLSTDTPEEDGVENNSQFDSANIETNENNTSKVTQNTSIDKENNFIESEIDTDKRKTNCISFFDEFVHQHLDEKEISHREEIIASDESCDKTTDYDKSVDVNETSDKRKSSQSSLIDTDFGKIDSDEEIIAFDESSNETKHNDEHIDLTGTSDDQNVSKMSFNHTNLFKSNEDIITLNESSNKTKGISGTSDNRDSLPMSFNDGLGETDKEVITFDESSNETKYDENIDLTQTSGSSEESKGLKTSNNAIDLGKKDDISIDYDEIFDDVVNSASASKSTHAIYEVNGNEYNDTHKKISITETEYLSQESVFEISDNELDYSMQKSRHEIDNFDIGGLSVINNITSARSSEVSELITNNISEYFTNNDENDLPKVDLKLTRNITNKSPSKHYGSETSTINEVNILNKLLLDTPDNSKYIVKTDEVTPMVDYETLSTPEMNKELDKYGLKPLKRKRAIQLLSHLYNQTHPIVECCEDLPSPSKRQKQNPLQPRKIIGSSAKSPRKLAKSPRKSPRNLSSSSQTQNAVESTNEVYQWDKANIYEITAQKPVIKDLGSNPNDWVFQKREKAKLHTCRVPLHIAFHNYMSCRRGLLEAILRYEPVNIDCIHKGLVAEGYRYDAKDLLRFLDRKCITVKTENNNKNKKHY